MEFGIILDDIIRQTKNGPIRGEKRTNSLYPEESFLAFHAIPYADPPIEDKRFMHPRPHNDWTKVYDASSSDHKNKCCPQVNFKLKRYKKSLMILFLFCRYSIKYIFSYCYIL